MYTHVLQWAIAYFNTSYDILQTIEVGIYEKSISINVKVVTIQYKYLYSSLIDSLNDNCIKSIYLAKFYIGQRGWWCFVVLYFPH